MAGRGLSVAAAAAWAVVALLWALGVAGLTAPEWLARAMVGAAAVLLLLRLGASARRALRSDDAERRHAAWALGLLLALSFGLRLTGLAFEITGHYHNDEGVFLAAGRAINAGDALPRQLHYPHLLHYASALALWLGDLFPGVVAWLGSTFFGVGAGALEPLTLRLLAATFGALTTAPVFAAARRVGSLSAAVFAGALIAVSPVFNEVSHLAISDVPSAFFAALTVLFAARLLDGESRPGYLAAGVAAGLAAVSKYPAGVSAVAIAAVWIWWRLRRRDLNGLLIWAAAAALVTILLVMPALWLRPGAVIGGPGDHDILFGLRQYAERGWIGVVPGSTVGYYLRTLAAGFGAPALVAGLAGLAVLPAATRRRSLVLLGYPLVYLLLLVSMNMVVKRNLQPVLPAVAVVLGLGLSAWPLLIGRLRAGAGRWSATVLALVCLTPPAAAAVAWDVSRMRPGTRELAVDWIETHVPEGAAFVKEAYTPDLHARRYVWQQTRYAGRLELDEILDPRWDFLLLARNAHLRFLREDRRFKPHHQVIARRYERLFDLELVERFAPGALRSGPDLLLYRLDPERVEYESSVALGVADVAWYSDPALRPTRRRAPIRFTRRGQSVLFKRYLEPGSYELSVVARGAGVRAWLYVVTRDNREIAELELTPGAELSLPSRDKYFLRLFLSPGGVLRELQLTGRGDQASSSP